MITEINLAQYYLRKKEIEEAFGAGNDNAAAIKAAIDAKPNLGTTAQTAAKGDHTHSNYLTSHNPIDSTLSLDSTNAVENKVIYNALRGKSNNDHTHSYLPLSGGTLTGAVSSNNNITTSGTVQGAIIKKNNGTNTQFLKADGSVDSNTYLTTSSASSTYLSKTDASNTYQAKGNYLTSHQDISGKAPNNHASTATTYGVGTTNNYGHVKTVNNLTTASHTDGLALSAYQGKVLQDNINNKTGKFSTHIFSVGSSYVKFKYNEDITFIEIKVPVASNVVTEKKKSYSANVNFSGDNIFANLNIPKPPFSIWARNNGDASLYGGMNIYGDIIVLCEDASFTSSFTLQCILSYPLF